MTLPDDVAARPLVPLPGQPEGVPWPTHEWSTGEEPTGGGLAPLLDAVMDPDRGHGRTRAVVVVHRGRLVAERYGLAMRDGLGFAEDYAPDDQAGAVSHVIEMLFGSGASDVASFAASRPLAHEPGTVFNYSSGTSNIISGIVARALGGEEPYRRFLHERLFDPIGMRTADTRGSRSWCAPAWTSWSCGSGSPPPRATPPSSSGGPRWWTRSAERPTVRGAAPNRPGRGNRRAGSCRQDRPAGRRRACPTSRPDRP